MTTPTTSLHHWRGNSNPPAELPNDELPVLGGPDEGKTRPRHAGGYTVIQRKTINGRRAARAVHYEYDPAAVAFTVECTSLWRPDDDRIIQ